MSLLERIENRTAVIGIVGLGYVGLPLAVIFSEAGFRVKGIDVDADKVAMLNRQESYIEDVDSATLALRFLAPLLPGSLAVPSLETLASWPLGGSSASRGPA